MNTDMRKEKCREYAAFIINDGKDVHKRAEFRKFLGFPCSNNSDEKHDRQDSRQVLRDNTHIGIWKAEKENGQVYFIRDEKYKAEFYRWAKIHQIPPKSNKYRIAFIGESVARGYLYDPYITPASVLEKTLNNNLKGKEVEIIDLARLGLRISGLEKLCRESMLLEPDMIVIFAGNNWRAMPGDFSDDEKKVMISSGSQSEMFSKLNEITKRKTVAQINHFMDELNKLSQIRGIPVVIIIPEFNLKGWKHNIGGVFFPISGNQQNECIQLKQEIEQAITNSDYAIAKNKSEKLIELDNISSLGYEYLAQCELHLGNLHQARKNFETAKDHSIYLPYFTECCYSFVAQTLVKKASEYHFKIVNLPELFKKYGDGIPGYDLFLEYCHLNFEGIYLAMKHTAERILPILGGAEVVKMEKIKIENEKLSRTCFFAALYCAHFCQPYEVQYNFCCEALQLSLEISKLMISYITLATRKVMWLLNAEILNVVGNGITDQYPYLIRDDKYRSIDVTLVKAMTCALQHFGINLEKDIDALRICEHKAQDQFTNLLKPLYRNNSYINQPSFTLYETMGLKPRSPIFERVRNVETGFFFIAARDKDVTLKITMRNICENHKTIKFHFTVNELLITEFEVSHDWNDIYCHIEKKHLAKDGVNKIAFIRSDQDQCFDVSRRDQVSLHDALINNLYGAHCQIREFTMSIS